MGLLKKIAEMLDPKNDSRLHRYYDAWNEYAPSMGLVPLEELPADIAKIIELSEFLSNETHEVHFPCKRQYEDFDFFTFYLIRFFSVVANEDEACNCFVGVVKFPFKGGEIILRNQRNKRFKDRGPGLNFEHKDFSDETWVMADPEVLAYQFFHPRMIEHFQDFWGYGYQLHAFPGYIIFFQYMPWDMMAYDVLKEPNYEFKRIKGFNNVAKKFFPEMLELIPNSLKRGSKDE